jgi:hypothetical protein
MVSFEPAIRRCMSSESTLGTMRSFSPFAINVGWVIADRLAGVERPQRLIALSWSDARKVPQGAQTRRQGHLGGRAARPQFRQGVRGELVLYPGDACPELPDQTESQTPWGHLLVLVDESKRRPIKRARLPHRIRCYSSRCRPGISIPIDHGSSGLRREGARKGQGGRKNQMSCSKRRPLRLSARVTGFLPRR